MQKPKERFSFGAPFRDENDINEKAIIGFASFINGYIWYSRFSDCILGYGF